jgi:hypothetical protein
MYLCEGDIQQRLLEELTDSDQSSFSDSSDSSVVTEDLTVSEVIGAECNDNENDKVQFATASRAPSAIFTWEDMTNYVGQREQFVDNCGPQNEAQNETHCAKESKMFFDGELMEQCVKRILMRHKKYKLGVSFHCVPECGTGNLSLQTKGMLC